MAGDGDNTKMTTIRRDSRATRTQRDLAGMAVDTMTAVTIRDNLNELDLADSKHKVNTMVPNHVASVSAGVNAIYGSFSKR